MPTDATPDCFTGLIGLSAAGSTCFPLPSVTLPATNAGITDSLSGLYLDTVEGLTLKPATGQPADSDLYARLAAARALTLPSVRSELAKRRAAAMGAALYQQRGTLGGLGNGSLLPAGSPARMELYTNATRSGAFRILSMQLYTDVAVTNVPILLDGAQIGTLSAGGPSGQFVALVADADRLRIPLDGNRHTLEALLPDGVRVRSNDLWCAPCQRNTPWGQALSRGLSASGSGGGFAVQILEECTESLDAACYAISTDEELRLSVAFAVLYKSAEFFVKNLSVAATANRYLMLEPKELTALATFYEARCEQHLAWLSGPDGLARIQHPCYAGPAARMGKTRTT